MPPRNNRPNEHRMSQDEKAGSFYRLSKNLSEFDIEKLSWLELQVLAQDTGFSESQVVEHALMLAPNARFPKDIREDYGYERFHESQRNQPINLNLTLISVNVAPNSMPRPQQIQARQPIICYNCGEPGHIARGCRVNQHPPRGYQGPNTGGPYQWQ